MKITAIDTFVVDAGWRPWQFVAVRTDAGITGYGECSDGRMPYSVVSTAREFETILLGQDPRPVEARYWDLYRMSRQSAGGIAAKAIAGIELAPVGYQGKGARRARIRAARRAYPAAPARLLVALRNVARAQLRHDRRAAAPDLGRHKVAGKRGGRARIHRAKDKHRLSRRPLGGLSGRFRRRWGPPPTAP